MRGTRIAAASPGRTQPFASQWRNQIRRATAADRNDTPAPPWRDVLEIHIQMLRGDGGQLPIGLRDMGQKPLDLPSVNAARAPRPQSVALLGGDKIFHFTCI